METNEQPKEASHSMTKEDAASLYGLAIAHRRVVFAVLLRMLGWVLQIVTLSLAGPPAPEGEPLGIIDVLLMVYGVAVAIYSIIAVYKLAKMLVREQGIGILFAALMFIPIIGLIILLWLSQRSTKILRRYGARVGLMGADLNSIDYDPSEATQIGTD